MVTVKGQRGKSKADVSLSVGTVFNSLALHVWEGTGNDRRITHTFYPDEHFLHSLQTEATAALTFLQAEKERLRRL